MATFLFDQIIFGPVKSRRLGASLGINLLPDNKKICNFNCVYCECGLTFQRAVKKSVMPSREDVRRNLEIRLNEMKEKEELIDTITFAGNGEPTLHPDFSGIIDDTLEIRDRIFPSAKVAVLSNATLINKKDIFGALIKVDQNILKLDSVIPQTQKIINCPSGNFSLTKTIQQLTQFKGNLIIQTLFFKGNWNGKPVDNMNNAEVGAWLDVLNDIKPELVMIYTINRDTPYGGLLKASLAELEQIADKVEALGIPVQISD
jgi:wyosine [tRNA(Phe)-imidazoG37] synthetase (radical SAM superfamily)